MEGRDRLEGSPPGEARVRTQSRVTWLPNLKRVNEAAHRDRRTKFTALLHHVDETSLRRSFHRLRREASAGVDGQTVDQYAADLDANLASLCTRVHTGRYRPQPVRRVYIPKADGGQRPLGIPALEDKIVQGAVAEVLSAIYEVDFVDASYGFRPGRSAHQAVETVRTAVVKQGVNWVLEADFRRFFDSVDHELLRKALQVRIADPRVLRLIDQWLRAGVLESGEWQATKAGTPQGAVISPLLANVFLHYALDVWVERWAREHAQGRVTLVRYADDFVVGFTSETDARRMEEALRDRMRKCRLALHEGKTRLLEFGRAAATRRAQRGERRPGTLDFLGFTLYCSTSRAGKFLVKCKTQGERMRRKLKDLRQQAKRRRHLPLACQHQWLSRVLRGHYAYYGVTHNYPWLARFYHHVRRLWYEALRRRDGHRRLNWARFCALLKHFPLPLPRITHSWLPKTGSLG
jgi:group II intron reverse transcriptase/maturase